MRQQHIVNRPGAVVAAWFVGLVAGTILLTLNEASLGEPGALEYAEAWFRLNALARGRDFGVLFASEVAEVAHLVVGHQHVALS